MVSFRLFKGVSYGRSYTDAGLCLRNPLYEQLCRFVIGEVRSGRLKEGEKLPSKRALCEHLRVSRSTVESAYEILAAEGYVEARARSGYYVRASLALESAPMDVSPPDKSPRKAAGGEPCRALPVRLLHRRRGHLGLSLRLLGADQPGSGADDAGACCCWATPGATRS